MAGVWALLSGAHDSQALRPELAPQGVSVTLISPGFVTSEIRHVDDQLARVLDVVDLDRTIVVVTSDHGEGLGDHGVHGHTAGLYDMLIRVPLIVVVPGGPARRAAVPASTIDLAPTIAAFAGVAPDRSWTGRATSRPSPTGATTRPTSTTATRSRRS